jgi:DNA-binding LytR/AlgR family response regulator
MPTALIADDEALLREVLCEHLQAAWPELEVVAQAADGIEALRLVSALRPDIAFLDIDMPGLSGLQVAQSLARAGEGLQAPRVVFITSHAGHALEAFEADAVDYIVKPLEPERLVRVAAKLRRALQGGAAADWVRLQEVVRRLSAAGGQAAGAPDLHWLRVSTGSTVHMVHVRDVQHFESDAKYTRVVSAQCDGLIRTSIKELAHALGADYVLAHRGVLVNRHYIQSIVRRGEQMELEMKDGKTRLKVSAANQHLFRSM